MTSNSNTSAQHQVTTEQSGNSYRDARTWLTRQFELSRGDTGGNVRPMEGMRGLAVFFVFLVHFVTLVEPWLTKGSTLDRIADAIHAMGMTGVDLFFVLSGYLIYGSLMSRPQPFGKFMARRVERIYPAFLAVLAVYLVLSALFPSESKIPSPLTAGVIYIIQNILLLPGVFPIKPVITQAWSLSYEMLYYMAIPILISMLNLRARSVRWRVTLFGGIAFATAVYCAAFIGPIRLIMFIAGIFLFEAMRNPGLPVPASILGLAALLSGLLVMLVPIPGSVAYTLKISVLFCCFFIFCFSCFKHPNGVLARTFSWTPLRWLGNMSYSYYLLHGVALKAGFLVLSKILPASAHGPALFLTLMPIMFVLTLAPSTILFLLIEKPYSLSPRRQDRHTTQATLSP